MKKKVMILLTFVMLGCTAFGIVACGDKGGNNSSSVPQSEQSSEIHTHDYVQIVSEPTCTEKGYTTYTCSCGDTYAENYVDELGHTYTENVTAPTCTEKGYTTYTCFCGDTCVENYVDELGHKFETHPAKEATCTEIGWNAYVTCESDNCDYSTYQEIPMLDHPIEKDWTINDTYHWYNTICDCNLTEQGATVGLGLGSRLGWPQTREGWQPSSG